MRVLAAVPFVLGLTPCDGSWKHQPARKSKLLGEPHVPPRAVQGEFGERASTSLIFGNMANVCLVTSAALARERTQASSHDVASRTGRTGAGNTLLPLGLLCRSVADTTSRFVGVEQANGGINCDYVEIRSIVEDIGEGGDLPNYRLSARDDDDGPTFRGTVDPSDKNHLPPTVNRRKLLASMQSTANRRVRVAERGGVDRWCALSSRRSVCDVRRSLRTEFKTNVKSEAEGVRNARKQRRTCAGEIECMKITPTCTDSLDGPGNLVSAGRLCRC